MKTAVKDERILSKETEVKTLEFDFCMLDCSFQVFVIIFNCLHCAILFQCHSMGKELWFYFKKWAKYFVYISSQSDSILQVSGREKTFLYQCKFKSSSGKLKLSILS